MRLPQISSNTHPERPMTPEAQIALYGLLVTVFGLLVTAGNYFVQKYLDKSRKGMEKELQDYRDKGAPTPDFVTQLYDDNKLLNTQKSDAEKKCANLGQQVKDLKDDL